MPARWREQGAAVCPAPFVSPGGRSGRRRTRAKPAARPPRPRDHAGEKRNQAKKRSVPTRPLEPPRPKRQHQGIAPPGLPGLRRLDRRRFVNHAGVVQQHRRPWFRQGEAQAGGRLRLEDAGLPALDAVTRHQRHADEIDAVAVRAFWRRSADTIGGIDAERVRLDEPALRALQRRRARGECGEQAPPCGVGRQRRLDLFEMTLDPPRARRCSRPAASAVAGAPPSPIRRRR